MPSPFPGMDPFLEKSWRWELFHAKFLNELARFATPAAQERGCWIDVERDVFQVDPSGEIVLLGEPDQVVSARDSDGAVEGGLATMTLAAPQAIHEIVLADEDLAAFRQSHLVVREDSDFPRVLAVVELLSPANKSGNYAAKYNDKRTRLLASTAHFMEIDWCRVGRNPLRDHFPELPPTPYFIFIARKTGIGRNEEAYPLRLQDPLPTVGLPVWGRRDLPLDLATAFRSAYELSFGGGRIRYGRESVPEPPLSAEDAKWVEALLAERQVALAK